MVEQSGAGHMDGEHVTRAAGRRAHAADQPAPSAHHGGPVEPGEPGEPVGSVVDAASTQPGRSTLLARLRQGPGAGVALVLGAAGLLFVASGSTAQGTDLRDDTADLASLVADERGRAERSTTLVESLRAEVETLQAGANAADPQLEETLARMSEAAGMQAVTGPAVRVVLDDADPSSRLAARARPDDLVVHQQDVQAVVNALWLGGAEAMQLMDQRVISTSAVRCIGNTLSLQGQPYSPPYVITAVGDPERLLAALAEGDSVARYRTRVDVFGLGYEVDTLQQAELPAYSGPLELRHAQVRTT